MSKLTRTLLSIGLAGAALAGGVAEAAGSAQAPGESNLPFLFAVFAITWAAFFAYLFYVSRRERELRREVDALRRALREKEEAQASSSGQPSQE